MKTHYLVSVSPNYFDTVVESLQGQKIKVGSELKAISTLSVSCSPQEADAIKKIKGVLAVESEGKSHIQ